MSAIEFNLLGNANLTGVFAGDASVLLREPTGDPAVSNNQVDSSKPFDIEVTFSQAGGIADNLVALGGTWTVEVLYDQIGNWWVEGYLPNSVNPTTLMAVDGPFTYQTTFTVSPGDLAPGVYALGILITGEAGTYRFSGYEEIRPFRVY